MAGIGLLQKANLLNDEGLAFFDFIKSNNIKSCAILKPVDEIYIMSNSYGFDGKSILLSDSTWDFWQGTIPQKNSIYNFDREEGTITALLQFFSQDARETINHLSIFRTIQDDIFILCNQKITDDIVSDLKELKSNKIANTKRFNLQPISKEYKYELNINDIISRYMDSKSFLISKKDYLLKAITNEFYNRLQYSFGEESSILAVSDNSFKIIYGQKHKLPVELLQNHIRSIMKDVIDKDADELQLQYYGECNSYEDAVDFLKA